MCAGGAPLFGQNLDLFNVEGAANILTTGHPWIQPCSGSSAGSELRIIPGMILGLITNLVPLYHYDIIHYQRL